MASGRAAPRFLLGVLLIGSVEAGAEDGAPSGWARIGNPADKEAVERVLRGVEARLHDAECRLIFSDFKDGDGRSLQEGLDVLGLPPDRYLGFVFFYDGFGQGRCMEKGIYATTAIGSRVVRMCGPRFTQLSARQPEEAQAVLIHEVLHTLGLGENPPASAHITQRVVERCYPERVAGLIAKRREGKPALVRP